MMRRDSRKLIVLVLIVAAITLTACGGGGGGGGNNQQPTYKVGGVVSGLAGTGLILQNKGGDDLHITTNGSFAFVTQLATGATYSVTVKTHPSSPNQVCTASNNTGAILASNVANVSIVCSTITYSVGGVVSGLTGTGLILRNNSADNLQIVSNGSFTFPVAVADGAGYLVTVLSQPTLPSQTCIASSNSGHLSGSNISSVVVTCVNLYSVGVVASGLTGTGLKLQNNGVNDLSIDSNGTFAFATPQTDGSGYSITILSDSTGQICGVADALGTINGADITIHVYCRYYPPVLPKTGQIISYDNRSIDDGALKRGAAWPSPRFTVASSGTGTVVTDGLTGLMWSGNGSTPTFAGGVSTCVGGAQSWQSALNYVDCLNTNSYLGYNDWRLPNRNEFMSLLNYSEKTMQSYWLNSQGFSGVLGVQHWTSTTYIYMGNLKNWAWFVTLQFQGG